MGPSSIQRGLEWTQLLKRLIVLCLFFDCQQIFSFFPLSSFSFYTVQYRRVQYSTVIYLLASSLEYPERIRVDSVVLCLLDCKFSNWPAPSSIQRGLEWTQLLKRVSVCLFLVSKFSNFSLFHPSLFIQYSKEECSTVQLLASSLEYPQRIEWTQLLKRLSVCLFHGVCKFSNFSLFHPSLFIQKSAVQYSYLFIKQAGALQASSKFGLWYTSIV